MRIILFLLFSISYFFSYSNKIDSLSNVLDTISEGRKPEVLCDIGFEHYKQKHYNEAIDYSTKALELIVSNTNNIVKAEIFNNLGLCYSKIESPFKSIKNFEKSISIYQELGDNLNIASNLNDMGIVYERKGDYVKALDCYLKASELIDELESEMNESSVMRAPLLNNIGVIYFRMNNSEKAKEYFNKAFKIHEKNDTKKGMAFSLNALGIVSLEEKKNEKALEYYNQSLNISKELDNKKEISITLNNIGVIYEKIGKYDQSIKYYNQVIELNKKQGGKMIISSCLVNIGLVKYNQKKILEGIKYCLEGLKIAKKENILNTEMKACNCLVDGYEKIGQKGKALKYYKQARLVKDSLYDIKKAKELTKMEIKYEFEKQRQTENLRWEFEKTEQETIIKNQKKWILFSILVAVAILFFLIILLFQRKQTLFANEELVRRNLELVDAEKLSLITQKSLEEEIENKETKKNEIKYSASAINEDYKRELLDRIVDLMETQHVYSNSNISVGKLAEILNTNKNYISQTLNTCLNKTFNNFINEYRVKEARKLLSNPSNKNITIEGISIQVGFNSKSAFNTAFKKHTGITPSYFMKTTLKVSGS